ncbi:MAG TPA: alpha/beta hydrolase family protein [Bryobacteraceae bacterium]|jgi:dienelactone hydrolase
MTRRDLGRIALAGAAALNKLPAQDKPLHYTGALDGFENKVDAAGFDPVLYTKELHDAAPLQMTFRATTLAETEAWQRALRAKVAELVGGFPAERAPLQAQTLEVREYPAYRREKFVFESRPGVWVLGYLLTPKARGPFAAVIALPGHGRGVDDIVGIDEHGRDRTLKGPYEYDFAIQIVEHGMAAVAIEPMAFGCRRDAITKAKGLTATACQPVAGSALLLGQTMIGWRVYDTMRAIDWIATRLELDAARVGCLGCSGGGTCTLFTAALDTRVRAALVSSYLNTFRASIMSVSHCIDNYVPGILNWAEMYDVAGLVAPRALFAEGGLRDTIFPIAATRASFDRVKKVYQVFGAADRAGLEIFDGPHGFSGKLGLPFLAKHLAA